MTKMKSKKMTKSTFAIIIMGIVMVAMLAFGGTFAYFTAKTTSDTKTLQTGYVKLESNGALAAITATNVMPGQEILAASAVKLTVDTSEAGNYVAIKFTITAKDSAGVAITDLSKLGLNLGTALGDKWIASGTDNIYLYGAADAATVVAKGELVVNAAALTFEATDNWTQGQTSSDNKLMNAEITITMEAHSIQSTGVDAATAKTELVNLFA